MQSKRIFSFYGEATVGETTPLIGNERRRIKNPAMDEHAARIRKLQEDIQLLGEQAKRYPENSHMRRAKNQEIQEKNKQLQELRQSKPEEKTANRP